MENYTKGDVIEVEDDNQNLPFKDLPSKFIHMKIKAGSKLHNIMGYAIKQFKEEDNKYIVFSGTGHAVTKTVTCVEIMKRKFKGISQITKIAYRKIEEIWEPKIEGLDKLKVVRDIPAIHILLSKEPLDENELGYQAPGNQIMMWRKNSAPPTKRKPGRNFPPQKTGGSRGRGKKQRGSPKDESNEGK